MDQEIWSRLPEHLLDRVLSFLPLKTFLSLRSTCKRFGSLLFSPTFISRHSPASSPFSSFLLLSHPQFPSTFPLFDTVSNSWRNLPIPFSRSPPSSTNLLGVSDGRLCFSHPTSSSFFICNFLAKSSRVIQHPTWPSTSESLTLLSNPNGTYKLLLICGNNVALFYDSPTRQWHTFEGFNQTLHHENGVFHKGSMYFITPEPFSVVDFDLGSGKWGRPRFELPSQLVFARLVSDGKRKMYLIGGIGRSGISRSVKLFELDEDGEGWVEVERVPEMMMRKFVSVCYHKYEHVYCFWHEGLVCVCCYTWPEILYYKVSRRTWHWLPKCPFLPEKWSCGFRWFSFVPQLYAFA